MPLEQDITELIEAANRLTKQVDTLSSASQQQRGLVRLASGHEIEQGTATDLAVSPADLHRLIKSIVDVQGAAADLAITPEELNRIIKSIIDTLSSASQKERGLVRLASPQETIKGTAADLAVPPLELHRFVKSKLDNLNSASQKEQGLVRLASPQETIKGTAADLAVPPLELHRFVKSKLDNLNSASQKEQGLVRLASLQETIKGTAANLAITPVELHRFVSLMLDQYRASESTVGAVTAFAGNTPPAGWLECNGAAISRRKYRELFIQIGTQYGAGDGSATFNLPDLRGEFVRGWDNRRGIDKGRAIGTFQKDEFKSHFHTVRYQYGYGKGDGLNGSTTHDNGYVKGGDEGNFIGNTGGSETRPRNVALMYCIKY